MNRLAPMVLAELLKLRKRRGLFWFSLFATVGLMVLYNLVRTAYHLSDPAKYSTAVGEVAFIDSLGLFTIIATLAPVMVGATAGAQDVETGVFRSLVTTGQSRVKLALVRIPGALFLVLPMLLAAYAIEVIIAAVPASGVAEVSAGDVATGLMWLAATAVVNVVLGLGVASLTGTRGPAIGAIIIWQVAAGHMVERIRAFGGLRALVSTVALDRFVPGATDSVKVTKFDSITVTVVTATLAVLAWILAGAGVGVWRTVTQDA